MPYQESLLAEGRVPSDGEQLNNLLDSVSTAIFSAYDAYGWIAPALLLTILFLALMALFALSFDDLPMEFLEGIPRIFLWTRTRWRGEDVAKTSGGKRWSSSRSWWFS